jgi:hypothetical protein
MDKKVTEVSGAEVLASLSSRKDFLKMAGAAGLGAALGANVFLRQAFALDPTDPTNPSFAFSSDAQYRPFDVISDNFVEHSDSFTSQGSYTIFAPAPELQRGSESTNDNALNVSSTSAFFTLFQTEKAPVAPYAAVIVDVKSFSGSAGSQDTVYVGLVKDASNYVVAWYNNATNKVGIDAVVQGTVNQLDVDDADLATPVRFAFVLNSKEVTALADTGAPGATGSPWKPLANFPFFYTGGPDPDIAPGLSQYVDLRDPGVLAQYRYGFGVRGDSGTITLDGVEAGYWGRAGVRDPHCVTWADGTPYIKDNKLYLTLTNAGCNFFHTAHWGVYTLDLSDYTNPNALEEVGKLFFKRDGKVLGDHAGHLVYDDSSGNFHLGVSTWGDFTYDGVQINYKEVSADVLHGVNVIEAKKLALPTTVGCWDPHFVRIGQRWYVAFVESPSQGGDLWKHYPALAKGRSGAGLSSALTLVGKESHLKQTEGMVMQKVGGEWYVLCSSGSGEVEMPRTYRIYNLNMRLLGTLHAPYPTNIPHPMITPLPSNGGTKWIMLTFDGTEFYGPEMLGYGTHGDFYVMDGPTWENYYDFRPRTPN